MLTVPALTLVYMMQSEYWTPLALALPSVSNTLNNGQPDRLLTQWAFFMLIINKLHAESLANCPPLVGLWVCFCTITRENQ
jgi:hypothetical protein